LSVPNLYFINSDYFLFLISDLTLAPLTRKLAQRTNQPETESQKLIQTRKTNQKATTGEPKGKDVKKARKYPTVLKLTVWYLPIR
jgi:hypothetical protein